MNLSCFTSEQEKSRQMHTGVQFHRDCILNRNWEVLPTAFIKGRAFKHDRFNNYHSSKLFYEEMGTERGTQWLAVTHFSNALLHRLCISRCHESGQ